MASPSLGSKRDWEVSEIDEAKGVCVHGIPVNVSPTKESRSTKGVYFFEAQLCDGKKCARVVSFDVSHRPAMKKAEEGQAVVALSNSNVKKSSFSSELEVHLHKRSKVICSPLKMSLGDTEAVLQSTKTVKVADIGLLKVKQDVELMCKVVKISDVSSVKRSGDGKELKKQEVMVGDETGTCRLVLWEGDVESLEEGKSYRLIDVGVRSYDGTKYLCYTAKSTKEETVKDLEEVNEEFVGGEDSEDMGRSMSGEISAVISTAEYFSCKFCHCKVELEEDGVVAECTKCGAMMKVSSCKEMKSAKFVVKDPSSSREMTLSVFEPVLSRIVAGVSGRNLSLKLLSAPKKMYRFNDRNVVYSVQEQ